LKTFFRVKLTKVNRSEMIMKFVDTLFNIDAHIASNSVTLYMYIQRFKINTCSTANAGTDYYNKHVYLKARFLSIYIFPLIRSNSDSININ